MKAASRVLSAVAFALIILSSGARASLPEHEDAVEEQSLGDAATGGMGKHSGHVAPVPPVRPRHLGKGGSRDAVRKAVPSVDDTSAGNKREYKVKGSPVTVRESQADGTEYYCLHPRRRMWVDGAGWVVRRTTTCF